jgi:multidrug efflux pump subunit AcrA (membrane-fusion protein)
MKKVKTVAQFIISNKWWVSGIIVVLAIFIFGQMFSAKTNKFETVEVKKTDLREIVGVTGRVKSAQDASLSFERGGNIDGVWVEAGDRVYRGQILVSLMSDDVEAQLSQAQALLKKEQARLDEIKSGTRTEEIGIQELSTIKAKNSLTEAANSFVDSIRDAYTKTDDSVRGKIDLIFNSPRSSSARLAFNTDSTVQYNLETSRVKIESQINSVFLTLSSLTSDNLINGNTDNLTKIYSELLESARSLADLASLAVNSLSNNTVISQTTIDTWKSNIYIARTNIANAASSLSAAQEKFLAAVSTYKIEQNRLNLLKAGPVKEQITAQEAAVEQAIANVKTSQAQLAKYRLIAPFDGVITRQDARLGEMATAGEKMVSVMSLGQFEMEAYIPEADIAKVVVGNKAEVTLDAYGSDQIFFASIYQIEQAETFLDGVATYKVKLKFEKEDSRIKSGMTANIDIITREVKDALTLPGRAITTKDGSRFVNILDNKKENYNDSKVEIGVKDNTGMVEIRSGLKLGDFVAIPIR